MGIKNWTVTAESTRSASAREVYMNDMGHKNHVNTEAILSIHGSAKTSANIIANCERRKMELAKAGKGGRPPTQAMEFVLTLPKGIRPSEEQWKKMMVGVVTDLSETLELESVNEMSGIVRAVVHQQKDDGKKQGSGDHMHLMIGKFTNSGVFLKKLQQRSALRTIKLSFNEQVKLTMGIDHAEYTANKVYHGVAKKRASQWKVNQARKEEALNKLEQALSKREMSQEMITSRFADNLEKLATHLDKYEQAVIDNNEKAQRRQLNRINTPLMQAREDQELDGFEYTDELENATRMINQRVDKINTTLKPEDRKLLLDVERPKGLK